MTRIDLDALRAESTAADHEVVLGGETFTLPVLEAWPVTAIEAVQRGAFADALRDVLGDDWDRFAAHRPTLGDCGRLVEALTAAQGVTPGESPRSSSSSRSTATRSRRTSSGSTESTSATSGAPGRG